MRKTKNFIIFFCLFSFILASENAEDTSGKIYYHWITKNKLYLWKDADREPVTVEREAEDWKLPEAEIISNQEWAALIKGTVPPEYLNDISTDKELWKTLLNYIYEQKPDDKKIKLKYPDVSIYFHQTSEKSGEMTFIFQKEILSFYFNKVEEKWKKIGSVPLGNIFKIDSSGFKKIFKNDIPGADTMAWPDFWNAVIKRFTSVTEPYSYFYENTEKKGQWLWIEKIESTNLIERMRPQPPKPETVTQTETVEAEPKVITQAIPWYIVLIICAIVFLTNPLSTFLFKFYRLRKIESLSKKNYVETLEDMETKNKNLTDGVKGLLDRIKGMQQKRENLIEVSIKKINEIKENEKFVKLGKSAYPFYKKSLKEDKSDLTEEQWIKYQFGELKKYKKNLEEKDKEFRKLNEENESIKKEYDKIFDELGKIEEVKGEKLIEKWDSYKKKLVDKEKSIKENENKLNLLNGQIKEINDNMDILINSIPSIESGLRRVVDSSKDKEPEIAPIISFLFYYSLFNIVKAIIKNEKSGKNIMLANIIKISEKLKESHSILNNAKLKEFEAVYNDITDAFPEILEQEFDRSGKSHLNSKFFQTLLKRLRDLSDSQLDCKPFYFDVDDSGKVHRAM